MYPDKIKTVNISQVGPVPASAQFNKILVVSFQGRETPYLLKKLERDVIRIGRAPDNDIQINSPILSDYHATLQQRQDGVYVIDGQDRNVPGNYEITNNGLILNNGQPVRREHMLESGDSVLVLAPGYQTVTLTFFDEQETSVPPVQLNKPLITIGRLSTNDLVLPALTVSGRHAKIEQDGRHFILTNESKTNPTFVNGKAVTRYRLNNGDEIGIGPFSIKYDGQYLRPAGGTLRGPRIDALHMKMAVRTRPNLKEALKSFKAFKQFLFKGEKILLNDVSVPIRSGEFVALVGGSGAGKSTLLKSLIGILNIDSKSQVLIDGDDLFVHFDEYRSNIGYVPQEDIIHNDLTVEQVLNYVIRLRDHGARNIKQTIDSILDKVQLKQNRRQYVHQLSGGQRKRLNVAVELAAEPALLVLDEPTSGLDPGLDLILMDELANLSRKEHKTVILVTHTTENIDKCHKIVFLAPGGRLAFYGRPAEAKAFFGVDKFSRIYTVVNDPTQNWPEKYKQTSYYKEYIETPLQTTAAKAKPARSAAPVKVKNPSPWSGLGQALTLAQRYFQNNLFFILALLIIPAFLSLLFYTVADKDLFSKLPFTLKDLATIMSVNEGWNHYFKDLQNVQQVVFMLATIAVFLGLFGAFQEITKERPIYDRERLVNLGISSYLFSKFLVLAVLAFFQSLIIMFVIDWRVKISGEGLTFLGAKAEVVVTLFLVTMAAVAMGLLISALVNRNKERSIIFLVFLVVVQILFSGAIFKMEGGSRFLTWVTFTRWGTEAMGSSVGICAMCDNADIQGIVERLPMGYGDQAFLLQHWGILLAYVVGLLLLTILVLRAQDVVLKREKRKK